MPKISCAKHVPTRTIEQQSRPMPNNTNSDTRRFTRSSGHHFTKSDEEDLMGIFRRSVFVVVTDIGIYPAFSRH